MRNLETSYFNLPQNLKKSYFRHILGAFLTQKPQKDFQKKKKKFHSIFNLSDEVISFIKSQKFEAYIFQNAGKPLFWDHFWPIFGPKTSKLDFPINWKFIQLEVFMLLNIYVKDQEYSECWFFINLKNLILGPFWALLVQKP